MKNLMLFHTLEFIVTYPMYDTAKNWSMTFDTMRELELQLEILENRWDDYDSPVISNVIIDGVRKEGE